MPADTTLDLLERAHAKLTEMRSSTPEGPWQFQSRNDELAPHEHYELWSGNEQVIGQLGCGCCDIGLSVEPETVALIEALHRTIDAQIEIIEAALHLEKIGVHAEPRNVALARAILDETEERT